MGRPTKAENGLPYSVQVALREDHAFYKVMIDERNRLLKETGVQLTWGQVLESLAKKLS